MVLEVVSATVAISSLQIIRVISEIRRLACVKFAAAVGVKFLCYGRLWDCVDEQEAFQK